MIRKTILRGALLASAGVAAFVGSTAFAQGTDGASANTGIGEILVTARKQTESLLDVPVAVTAIGAEEIQRTGVTDLSRIAALAPQVILAQADSGTGAAFSIRGLGTSFLDAGFDQSVIVNLDGAQISRGQIVLTSMFDMAGIEVLKGPQALFFGKNSPAGVVSISSINPTDSFEGYIRAGYEFEAREKILEAAVSGPLSDTFKARLAIRASDMRGWMKNMAVPLANPLPGLLPFWPVSSGAGHNYGPGSRDLAGRATLVWEPSSNFSANLKVTVSRHKDNGSTTQQYCDPALSNGPVTLIGIEDPTQDCKFDNKIYSNGVPQEFVTPQMVEHGGYRADGKPYAKVDSELAVLTLNYDMEDLTLTSVSTYMHLTFAQANNYDFTSWGLASSSIGEANRNYSQEFRLVSSFDAPVNFTLGTFYEKTKRTNYTDSALLFLGPNPAWASAAPGVPVPTDPNFGRYDTFNNGNLAGGKTLSAFGQLRWKIVEQLELAGGARYTQEKRSQTVVNNYIHSFGESFPSNGFVPVGVPLSASVKSTNWSPEATLTFKPTDDSMIYAAYKTGYKSGGFPATNLFVNNSPHPVSGIRPPVSAALMGDAKYGYGAEKAKGFEAGFKAKMLDNTLLVQGTVYTYKYKDLQQSIFNPPTFSYIVTNADAKVRGAELSLLYQPIQDLRINAAAAYNKATYSRFTDAGCYPAQPETDPANPGPGLCINYGPGVVPQKAQNLTGRPLPRAPKWNLNAGITYDTPISDGWVVGFNGDVNYTSGYITQENQAPFAYQKGFALFNAGLRLYQEDDGFELAVIGRNLADKRYVQVSTSTSFAVAADDLHAATPRGREIRVQSTFRF